MIAAFVLAAGAAACGPADRRPIVAAHRVEPRGQPAVEFTLTIQREHLRDLSRYVGAARATIETLSERFGAFPRDSPPRLGPAGARSGTSSATIRPPGPLPRSARKSTPRSVASLRAAGVAFASDVGVPGALGPPLLVAVTPVCGAGVEAAVGRGGAVRDAASSSEGAPPLPAAGAAAPALGRVSVFAPCSSTSAITAPTAALSPSCTLISRSTPPVAASSSMSALSVSTSASTSPRRTSSPTCFSHLRMVPSSIVSLSFGITISTLMAPIIGRREGLRNLRFRENLRFRRTRREGAPVERARAVGPADVPSQLPVLVVGPRYCGASAS